MYTIDLAAPVTEQFLFDVRDSLTHEAERLKARARKARALADRLDYEAELLHQDASSVITLRNNLFVPCTEECSCD